MVSLMNSKTQYSKLGEGKLTNGPSKPIPARRFQPVSRRYVFLILGR